MKIHPHIQRVFREYETTGSLGDKAASLSCKGPGGEYSIFAYHKDEVDKFCRLKGTAFDAESPDSNQIRLNQAGLESDDYGGFGITRMVGEIDPERQGYQTISDWGAQSVLYSTTSQGGPAIVGATYDPRQGKDWKVWALRVQTVDGQPQPDPRDSRVPNTLYQELSLSGHELF